MDENVQTSSNLLTVYEDLLTTIKENAKEINNFYHPESGGNIFKNFKLDDLFRKIHPKIFNFVCFLTLSDREKRTVYRSEKLKDWIMGKCYLLDIYDCTKHKVFIR